MDTLRKRYFKGTKKEKGEILNEYCRNTKQERKYVIKKFNYKVKLKTKENRKKRARFYDGHVIAVLVEIWKIFDYPCGQRLEEILETETENLRVWKEIVCSDEIAEKLKKMKSATIDRRLNHEKEVLKLKEKYRKKSSFLLSTIPVKTSADFDRNIVGNEQVDFVESCGASASGEYVNNLSICDIFSSWWEGEAIMGKGQKRALLGLDNCRKRTPFMWKEFHPDNGTNLLNYAVYAYAEKEGLKFSRSRPYHKNDNCFIEQKNSTHVRQVIGYLRYDTQEELDCLNDLYRNELRLYKNFFQPVIKLKSKERIGGHIKRKYDRAKTPYRRLMESDQISEKEKEALTTIYQSLNPAELKRKIDKRLDNLYKIYQQKKGRENINLTNKLIPSLVSFSRMSKEKVSVS
ncbi:MAG: transposase [bacterium]|nr:transposase [bacterium]